MKRNTVADFWPRVVKGGGCWSWTGYHTKAGYGQFCMDGKDHYTHRLAYSLMVGDCEGLEVCHKCDNPGCCNPDHLFVGTHQENMADMGRKGRQRGPRKLSQDDVAQIKDLLAAGMSQSCIAYWFDCGQMTISNINTNTTWSKA